MRRRDGPAAGAGDDIVQPRNRAWMYAVDHELLPPSRQQRKLDCTADGETMYSGDLGNWLIIPQDVKRDTAHVRHLRTTKLAQARWEVKQDIAAILKKRGFFLFSATNTMTKVI